MQREGGRIRGGICWAIVPAFLASFFTCAAPLRSLAQNAEDSAPSYNPLEGLFTPQPQYPTPGTTIMNQHPVPQHMGSDASAPGRQPGTRAERFSGPEDLHSSQPKTPDAPNHLEGVFTAQPQYPKPGTTHLNPEPVPRHIGDDSVAPGRQPGSRVNVFHGETDGSGGADGSAPVQDKTNALRGLFTAQPQYVTPGKTVLNPDAVPKHLGDDEDQPGRQPGSRPPVFQHGLPSSSEEDQSFGHLSEDSPKSDSATPEAKESGAPEGKEKESVEAKEAKEGVKESPGKEDEIKEGETKDSKAKDSETKEKATEDVNDQEAKEAKNEQEKAAREDTESLDKDKEASHKDDKEKEGKEEKEAKDAGGKDENKETAEKEKAEDKGLAGAGTGEEKAKTDEKAHAGGGTDKEKAEEAKKEDKKEAPEKAAGEADKKSDDKNKMPPNNNPLAAAIHMLQIGEYQQSLDIIGKLMKAQPLNPQLFYTRAVVFVSMRKYSEAAADYQKVLSLAPTNSELAVMARGGLSKLRY